MKAGQVLGGADAERDIDSARFREHFIVDEETQGWDSIESKIRELRC